MSRVAIRKKAAAQTQSAFADARGYARKVWLAGLGAYTKVGQEGADYFKELVRTGEGVERDGKVLVNEQVEAANSQLDDASKSIFAVKSKVGVQLEKIEQAFDDRVAAALNRIGIPSRRDVENLSAKLDELSALLEHVTRSK